MLFVGFNAIKVLLNMLVNLCFETKIFERKKIQDKFGCERVARERMGSFQSVFSDILFK